MTQKHLPIYDVPDEDPKPQVKGKKNTDSHPPKGSIDLYSQINDQGINRIRDRVDPSNSIQLSKA